MSSLSVYHLVVYHLIDLTGVLMKTGRVHNSCSSTYIGKMKGEIYGLD